MDNQSATCPVDHENQNDAEVLEQASLVDQDVIARPASYFLAMRRSDPVHYDEKLNMWLVSRYEDILEVSRDPATYSVDKGYNSQQAAGFRQEFIEILERDGGGYFPDAIMTDPPYHTRIRKLMESAFTAHRVKELEPRIEAVVDGIIDEIVDKGECDAVTDLAIPLTIRIIVEQLGLDQGMEEKIKRWSEAVTAQIGRMQDRDEMLEHAAQICELQHYLINKMKEREADPREDMISDLVHAKEGEGEGSVLTFKEAVSLVRATLIAGNDTTATALGNLIFVLATEPEILKKLEESADDDRLLNRFVEELLRLKPPVRGLSRMTTREVELNGVKLPEGAHLLLMYGSANHQDSVFPCPFEFDETRKNVGRHIAFGSGPHRCIGLALARMEIKVAARQIVKRIKNIKLKVDPTELEYLPSVATHTIRSLPISYERRS